ncbi:hypothetical protein F0562_015508 [Nyssa sinensis]|uniref:Protein kinase domain-containing protein n=1 Tax=Nyssa sinensis TaxID=561372 RepID=A0A5J4ZJQ1_9ASTE|nr:hypothetical protein F0562_015508 [Nyssa sinensis]
MLRRSFLLAGGFVLLMFSLLTCKAQQNNHCNPSSCGHIPNISNPFRLSSDPPNCGHSNYELACENNRTIINFGHGSYFVEAITYENFSIRLVDPGLEKDNCSSLPVYSLTIYDLALNSSYEQWYNSRSRTGFILPYNTAVIFMTCSSLVNSALYMDTTFCSKNTSSNTSVVSSLQHHHSYVVIGDTLKTSDMEDYCRIDVVAWASLRGPLIDSHSFTTIRDGLLYGFELLWFPVYCIDCDGYCYVDTSYKVICQSSCYNFTRRPSLRCLSWFLRGLLMDLVYYHRQVGALIGLFLVARFLCCCPCVSAILVYKLQRRHLSMYDSIENFLQSHNNLMPIRYSYSDIKKMTNNFKEKLGEGGYGSVYKGKLRSGSLVAIKILGKSRANGQDFINEVATIGRIHHVNVVQLIGYCAERSKRALVYEFMPNGSLEKYALSKEGHISLSCEKMYEISLGVARGIDYLHRGCDMQILHFDIKPHNILLDENFTPKVSDFGLAKLYSTDDSIVSLTAARGTIGYMAPELFYKNIGGVSYKADVYSFGMLLIEMTDKRKNMNACIDHSSEIYFPSWVYDQLSEKNYVQMADATEEEKEVVKKMIIVALWCIQMKPSDRPSMNKVVEMLEGNVELLQMPPKPFLYPQEIQVEDPGANTNPDESSDSTNSITFDINTN